MRLPMRLPMNPHVHHSTLVWRLLRLRWERRFGTTNNPVKE
jgi:hypothetical protein